MFFPIAVLTATAVFGAASPGRAPQLPMSGARIVQVSTEPQLQAAMDSLRNGDTILLADGTYPLTRSLYVNGRHNVTVRGTDGSTNVVLTGKGMDNPNHGGVPFALWSNSTNTLLAHLTLRDTWDNLVIFNPGAQAPRIYCVNLVNAGSQFIKVNPTDVNAGHGVNDGVVEYCVFEYTGRPPNDHGSGVGYFNGISAHAARNWIVRGNLFKNLHNPDGTAYPWNPAVLFWRHSANTLTEKNVFINVDRAIAYGLENTASYRDHEGGVIRNNFVSLEPGLMSAARKASSDGAIIAWNSPGTQIDHNTLLLNSNLALSIEFRFQATANAFARNNLADAPIRLRDSATAVQSGNLLNAAPEMFLDPESGDLHLRSSATNAMDKAAPISTVTDDFDGDPRPSGSGPEVGADEFTGHAPPEITRFSLAGADAIIGFTTLAGLAYDIQRANHLTGAWAVVAGDIPGTGAIVEQTDTDGASAARRFYRVRTLP